MSEESRSREAVIQVVAGDDEINDVVVTIYSAFVPPVGAKFSVWRNMDMKNLADRAKKVVTGIVDRLEYTFEETIWRGAGIQHNARMFVTIFLRDWEFGSGYEEEKTNERTS